MQYTWKRFVIVEIRIGKIQKMCCYLIFSFLRFNVVDKTVFVAFLFYLLFSLSLALIISICYCLYFTSLSLHLITAHIVSHLSLSTIIFIISDTNYQHLYCLNYTSLFHFIITDLVNTFYNNDVINICPRQLL